MEFDKEKYLKGREFTTEEKEERKMGQAIQFLTTTVAGGTTPHTYFEQGIHDASVMVNWTQASGEQAIEPQYIIDNAVLLSTYWKKKHQLRFGNLGLKPKCEDEYASGLIEGAERFLPERSQRFVSDGTGTAFFDKDGHTVYQPS